MNKPSNRNDLHYANWALQHLVAGLLVLIVALVAKCWWSETLTGVLVLFICALLFPAIEGVALVLGILGRRHVRGQIALAGAIFLLLLALLGVCLFLARIVDRLPLG